MADFDDLVAVLTGNQRPVTTGADAIGRRAQRPWWADLFGGQPKEQRKLADVLVQPEPAADAYMEDGLLNIDIGNPQRLPGERAAPLKGTAITGHLPKGDEVIFGPDGNRSYQPWAATIGQGTVEGGDTTQAPPYMPDRGFMRPAVRRPGTDEYDWGVPGLAYHPGKAIADLTTPGTNYQPGDYDDPAMIARLMDASAVGAAGIFGKAVGPVAGMSRGQVAAIGRLAPEQRTAVVQQLSRLPAEERATGQRALQEALSRGEEFGPAYDRAFPELVRARDANIARMKEAAQANADAKAAGEPYPSDQWKALFPGHDYASEALGRERLGASGQTVRPFSSEAIEALRSRYPLLPKNFIVRETEPDVFAAFFGDKQVGELVLSRHEGEIFAAGRETEPAFQRLGVASALQDYAEQILGKTLDRSATLTGPGRAFEAARAKSAEGLPTGSADASIPRTKDLLSDTKRPGAALAALNQERRRLTQAEIDKLVIEEPSLRAGKGEGWLGAGRGWVNAETRKPELRRGSAPLTEAEKAAGFTFASDTEVSVYGQRIRLRRAHDEGSDTVMPKYTLKDRDTGVVVAEGVDFKIAEAEARRYSERVAWNRANGRPDNQEKMGPWHSDFDLGSWRDQHQLPAVQNRTDGGKTFFSDSEKSGAALAAVNESGRRINEQGRRTLPDHVLRALDPTSSNLLYAKQGLPVPGGEQDEKRRQQK